MTQLLYMLFGMVIILFVLAILFAVLPDKKEKKEEDKPIKKTPIRIELQIKYEGYLYTLYNDGTWDVDPIC